MVQWRINADSRYFARVKAGLSHSRDRPIGSNGGSVLPLGVALARSLFGGVC